MISFKDVAGSGKKQVTFDHVELEPATEYACEDSDITHMLAEQLLPEVKSGGFDELFRDMEMPLVKVLAEIEMAEGAKVSKPVEGSSAEKKEEGNKKTKKRDA